ncbi:MAG: 2-C-methyl-D-erythritol 4-phosphate cytidylyltransferase [Gammaproteobacteria bacterium]
MTSPSNLNLWAVIPAAGVGRRMHTATPKQYLQLQGRTVLEQTVHRLAAVTSICGIAIAVNERDPYWSQQQFDVPQRIFRAPGGAERCHSVLNALQVVQAHGAAADDWVLVHDAARPCVRCTDIVSLIEQVRADGQGGLLAMPVHDTMKQADAQQRVARTVERSGLWHALTPQMFRLGELHDALVAALDEGYLVTDEASAMEHAGHHPLLVEGHGDNIKITRPEDLALAEFYLQHQLDMTTVMDDGE